MPTLKVYIAHKGARLSNGEASSFGYMRYGIEKDGAEAESFGFGPIESWSWGEGRARDDDTVSYLENLPVVSW